jgi:hypothetical protein
MKARTASTPFILACAVSALLAGTAQAGQCTTEIDNVGKALASRDAGAGPTIGAPGSAAGQHPPTAAMGAADASTAALDRCSGISTAATSTDGGHEPGRVGRRSAAASGRNSTRATSSDRRHGPGDARRSSFAAGRAAPDSWRAHRGTAGGRCPAARDPDVGVGTSCARTCTRVRPKRQGSRMHGRDCRGETACSVAAPFT